MSSLRSFDPVRQDRAAVFKSWAEALGSGGAYLTADLMSRANDAGAFSDLLRPDFRAALLAIGARN